MVAYTFTCNFLQTRQRHSLHHQKVKRWCSSPRHRNARCYSSVDRLCDAHTSKSSRQWGCKRMRSPFGNVRSLLSSMTLFMFSTQTASTSPSNTRYLASSCRKAQGIGQSDSSRCNASVPCGHAHELDLHAAFYCLL